MAAVAGRVNRVGKGVDGQSAMGLDDDSNVNIYSLGFLVDVDIH